jgi:hypothetical protein
VAAIARPWSGRRAGGAGDGRLPRPVGKSLVRLKRGPKHPWMAGPTHLSCGSHSAHWQAPTATNGPNGLGALRIPLAAVGGCWWKIIHKHRE